jgi:hypothetical protein
MKRIEAILADCLKDIEAGSTTIEECLERHRDISRELEPLLRLALDIEELPAVAPSPVFKARARANVVAFAREHPLRRSPWNWLTDLFVQPSWARAGVILLSVVVVITGAGMGTAYASQSSLPGDLLYPVKISTESLREWIETDTAGDVSLQIEFAARRIDEMEQLILESSPEITLAVSGYNNNLAKAIDYVTGAPSMAEDLALAVVDQLEKLDSLEDSSGDAADIVEAEQIAANGHVWALRYMSEKDPVQTTEMTLAYMQYRLERAAGAVSNGNTVRAENALRLFNQYAGLGDEISADSAGTDFETPVAALFQQAVQEQEQLFASFSAHIPSQVAGQVQMALQKMKQHGYGNNIVPSGPGNQGNMSGGQGEGSVNQGETPGNQDEYPGSDSETSGGQSEVPGSQDESPGSQDENPGGQGENPGNQGQANSSGSDNSSTPGMPPTE